MLRQQPSFCHIKFPSNNTMTCVQSQEWRQFAATEYLLLQQCQSTHPPPHLSQPFWRKISHFLRHDPHDFVLANTSTTPPLEILVCLQLQIFVEAISGWHSPRGPEFSPKPVHVRFGDDEVAMGEIFLRVLRFSIVSFHPRSIPAFSSSTNVTIQSQQLTASLNNLPLSLSLSLSHTRHPSFYRTLKGRSKIRSTAQIFEMRFCMVLNTELISINSKMLYVKGLQTSTCGPHYAARGHICKSSTYCKNFKII